MTHETVPPTAGAETAESSPVIAYSDSGSQNLYLPVVICRVLAIWMLAQGALQLTYIVIGSVAVIFDPPTRRNFSLAMWAPVAVPAIFWLLLALIVWWRAPWLARRISGGDSVPMPEIPGGDRLLTVALVVVGVLVLADAVPNLTSSIMIAFREKADRATTTALWNSTTLGELLKLAVGLWLVLGTEGVARLIHRLRHGPQHAAVVMTEPSSQQEVKSTADRPSSSGQIGA